jgi:hypothetical protein
MIGFTDGEQTNAQYDYVQVLNEPWSGQIPRIRSQLSGIDAAIIAHSAQ